MRIICIVTLIGFVFCIGCTKVLTSAYGVTTPRLLSQEQISLKQKELGITDNDAFSLDKKYFYALQRKDTMQPLFGKKCSPMISKYLQPLQVMYFDESGKLVSFHNNCYAGGFPILNWNHDGQFDTFVPATTIALTDTALNLYFLLPFLKQINNTGSFHKTKWTVIVFWCDFMLKQTKELIRTVRENASMDNSNSTSIYYVNVDNCYVEGKSGVSINKLE